MLKVCGRRSSFNVQKVMWPISEQFVGVGELDRPLRDQIAPNPVVMTNDADGIEVRAVAQGMAVGNHDNVVMVCDRRSHGRIDAQIGRPSRNQEPFRRDLL
jgi:hypothetical protein